MSANTIKKLLPREFREKHRDTLSGMMRWFVPPKLPKRPDGKTLVHLGCGEIDHPAFINVDALRRRHVHYIHTVEKLPMFADNSVNLIYCCHCLEHLSHLEVPGVLAEWCRVIKPGGILRLAVPDFDKILTIYRETGEDMNEIQAVLMGGQDYQYNFHKIAFNHAYLAGLMQNAGLRDVKEWQAGKDELTTFDDWSRRPLKVKGKPYPISLNLEGIKK
jgi:predicted SAM-dependent methyltransferase